MSADPRLKKIYPEFAKLEIDGLLVSSEANISYLSGMRSRDAYLIVSKNKTIYITDSRYTEEARKSLKNCTVRQIESSVFKTIAAVCKELKFNRFGFEERQLPYAEYGLIRQETGYILELIPTHGLVEGLRIIKTADEIDKIKRATAIAVNAFKFIKEYLRAGIKEAEIAAELERFIRYNGAYSSSFDIIVASGPNSCYPHHTTGARKLKEGEPVLIDLGVDYQGYKSDLTRTFFLGKINVSCKRIYNIVLEAQNRAIKAIKPGAEIRQIDAAARQFIAKKGYGRAFSHSTGHGIGIEVHEAPQISGRDSTKLKPGMVFTVEPAVYLTGKFGIRIEDMCLVTEKGAVILSGTLNK